MNSYLFVLLLSLLALASVIIVVRRQNGKIFGRGDGSQPNNCNCRVTRDGSLLCPKGCE